MLKLKQISKKFKNNVVIDKLELTVKSGECIYIHGKNGCGKSTLFKIICDILKADAGDIEIDENVYIGSLIENPGFIENETLYFNLKFLASFKKNYNEKKIGELCKSFSLDLYDKTAMKDYSVGMKQKAGIIQAVMENQNLILFDEPTRGLDEEAILVFTNIVNRLVEEENKSVIIASHDLLDSIHYTKFYHMRDGKLELE
ncbi:MAG: ATP-binding cassette domain-containing protein [Massilimicrobiota timonensis]